MKNKLSQIHIRNFSTSHNLQELAIFLLPLIFILSHQFYKNLYQSIPFWIVIILGLVLLPVAYQQIKKPAFRKAVIIFLTYLIALIISCLFSTNILLSLPVLFLNISYFVIFLASGKILNTQRRREIFVLMFIAVVTFLSAVSFYNIFFKSYNNLTSEGLSFMWPYFGHNHLAVLLILAIPLSIYYLWFSVKYLKILFFILLSFFLYSFLISFSRGAILALILAIVLVAIIFHKTYLSKLNFTKILLSGLLLVLLGISLLLIMERKSLKSFYTRTIYFQKGIEMSIQRPITGFGLGTFNETIIKNYPTNKGAFYVHNLFVQNLAEGGSVLFLSTIILFSGLMINSLKVINQISQTKVKLFYISLWIGLAGILINEMGDFDLQLPAVGVLFWLVESLFYFQKANDET